MSRRRRADGADALRTADAAARLLAVDEFERPVAIQAGAGTGKTRSLVARLATWILGPGWERAARELAEPEYRSRRASPGGVPGHDEIAARVADGVVAITFTEAAAAEMAERLGRALSTLASGEAAEDLDPLPPRLAGLAPDPQSAALALAPRAAALAAVLSRARVQTIHGFCSAILAEHPFEAKLHPELEIDADGARLATAAKESLLARLRAGDAALLALVAGGVDPLRIHEALVSLVGGGADPAELARPRFTPAVAQEMLTRFAAIADGFSRRLEPLAAAVGSASPRTALAADCLARFRELAKAKSAPGDRLAELAGAVEAERDAWKKAFDFWRKGELGKNEEKALGSGAPAFLAEAQTVAETLLELCDLDPELYERARRALGPLVEETRRRLRRAGVLSYDDLLVEAVKLLESNVWVRRRLRASIRQILVDEFQDTDRRQCRLLSALVFDGDEGERPGLFLVGDPKQSIYAWRSADLAAYEQFLAELRDRGGVEGRLAMNFRSAPPILAEVERSIAPAMVEKAGVQPPFEALFAGERTAGLPGFHDAQRAPVEFWLSWDAEAVASGESPSVERAAALEAAAIAAEIAALVGERRASWGDFALLLRARSDLEVYLDALRRAGVPYAVQKDRSYYRRREVIDLVSLLRLVLDPGDRLALVAALRSPFVGVPDAAWRPLFRHHLPEELEKVTGPDPEVLARVQEIVTRAAAETPAEIPGLAPLSDWPLALRDALAAVAELRASFRDEPVAQFLERLRARFLLEPIAASRFLGRFGLANLGRLLAEIETRFAEAADPLSALAELRAAVEEEAEGEEARPPDAGLDAVAVMTVHTAKGLEFEQVFVPQLHRSAPSGRSDAEAERLGAERSPTGFAEHRLFGAPSPGWATAERAVAEARDAETVRLLYVAMTRAESRLVLLGRWDRELRQTPSRPGSSFLDRLAARRPETLETLFQATGPTTLLDAGALWRRIDGAALPATREGADSGASSGRRRSAIVTAEARAASRARRARPRFATASRLAGAPEEPGREPETGSRPDVALGSERARARGVALHRALELAPLHRESPAAWRERVVATYRAERGPVPRAEARALEADLQILVGSRSWSRLAELESGVVARELPLVAAATPGDASGPLHGFLGTLDLLYRDAASGEVVVADFKSDPAPGQAGELDRWIAAKIALYGAQLRLYGDAARHALALPRPPRLELWLLAADRIALVPPQ